jgi:choline dehydrogenase
MSVLGAGATSGFDPGGLGPSDAIAFPNLYQLFGSEGNATAARIHSSIASWAASQAGSGLSAEALQRIFQVQANLITTNNGVSHRVCEHL